MTTHLVPFADGIWTVSSPLTFLGLHLGTRMTVVRLRSGGLLVHSPIALSPALRAEIDRLGRVEHIVAPNLYHHLYAAEHQKAWPEAILHAPARLASKRSDLRIDAPLGSAPHADWEGTLEPVVMKGSMLEETVLVHPSTGTLVSCDLVEQFSKADHLPSRIYFQTMGIWKKPGLAYALRLLYRDRRAARRSFDELLERDFDRIVLSHGDLIEASGREILRDAYRWLK
ncbi:DUF4336 domain-containing protein [Sandaracinus amylolyticus]|uniref:Methanol oxidation glmU-like protein n=1 Tax=Sandaracinus amylolyticus TaxID=927083 RepID=A0A0F6W1P6_9BACT|nr:DUF4336 domain-containing protein [Sandaracinus amylolyticus]AKF05243.1 Methanol oxidation glmU-like protein [Sandaracinus amylolyticus]